MRLHQESNEALAVKAAQQARSLDMTEAFSPPELTTGRA